MLSKTIEKALNEQIADEQYASNLYLSIAAWCDSKGLSGSAAFFLIHTEEERSHMLKLFKYILEKGGQARVPAIEAPPREFESLTKVVETIVEYEDKTTANIDQLVFLCQQEKDFATHNFLQWYVAEQVEEEALFHSISDRLKLIGNDGSGLYMLDREMATLHAPLSSASAQ